MNKIQQALILGLIAYAAIAFWQYAAKPEIFVEMAALLAVFGILAALFFVKSEEGLRCTEMAAIWGCIYLFILYGLLKASGVL